MEGPACGTVLTILFPVTESGVQFYTANFQTGAGTRKKIHGGSGVEGDGYPKEGMAVSGPGPFLTYIRLRYRIQLPFTWSSTM